MADVKISELPAASTPLAGTEQIPLVQDATTKQITVSNLLTSANLGTPSAINLANATNVPMDEASGVLAVANGGSGTATPALVAGTNVTISGSWPNQTINSTYSGAVTSVTGTAPVVSSGGTTPAISMAAATGSVNGYLTSTDWTTFNNKLTSGGPLGTPSSGTATNLTGLPLSTGVTGLLPVANGGTGTATPNLVAGSNVTISGTWPNQTIAAAGAAQVYPDAGIANSTGSAWGTSYSTTGSGTVVALATSPTFVTPALGVPASGDFSSGTFTWPTFNQNTSGTAANITATSNSTLTTLSSLSLPGSQVSGNISGNAGNVSGIVAVANGGTGTATPSLVAGTNVTITGTWPNQTIAASGGGGSGTVTSVSGTGTVNGLTLTGTVTTSGDLTLGGTLSGIANSALTNSSITIGGTAIALGASSNALANDITIYGITVGRGAGSVATNTAVGASALAGSNSGTGYNNAFGTNALQSNTSGLYNSAFGYALVANTTGNYNTAIGVNSTISNTTGSNNTAVGVDSLQANTTSSYNTAVGYQAAYSNTTGRNTAIGSFAAKNNTTGDRNTSLGDQTLFNNSSGSYNVAVGQDALLSNTTASNNTAVGYQAGYTNATGVANTFIGIQAGYTSNATSGYNVAIGRQAGYNLTTADNNTFVGANAGQLVTTGAKNTIIGGYSGNQGGLDIRTASNYIVLSDGDGNPRAYANSTGGWSFFSTGASGGDSINAYNADAAGVGRSLYTGWYGSTTPNTGTLSFNVVTNGNVYNTNNSYGALSDIKLKENIVDATPKLEKLCQVRVVNYNFKEGQTHKQLGVIAQELEQVFPSMVEETPDTDIDGNDLGTTTKSVKYSVFVPMLIKAIQELKAEFDAYKASHP